MLIQLIQNLYWPCWYIAATASVLTVTLAFLFGGHRMPMPESRLIYVVGWIVTLSLVVVLVPAVSFFASFMPKGIVEFVRDPETFKVSLSFLGGVRVLSGDGGYILLLAETVLLAALGGCGAVLALLTWPARPRRGRRILDAVLEADGPYD